MSYSTWHNYGYGICVDDIKTQDVKRLQALLELSPETKAKIEGWLSELGIKEPTWDDYMEFDQDFYLGLATILKMVIEEAEGISLTSYNIVTVKGTAAGRVFCRLKAEAVEWESKWPGIYHLGLTRPHRSPSAVSLIRSIRFAQVVPSA